VVGKRPDRAEVRLCCETDRTGMWVLCQLRARRSCARDQRCWPDRERPHVLSASFHFTTKGSEGTRGPLTLGSPDVERNSTAFADVSIPPCAATRTVERRRGNNMSIAQLPPPTCTSQNHSLASRSRSRGRGRGHGHRPQPRPRPQATGTGAGTGTGTGKGTDAATGTATEDRPLPRPRTHAALHRTSVSTPAHS